MTAEAEALVGRAVDEDNPYKIRRSTTGHKSWTDDEDATEAKSTMYVKRGRCCYYSYARCYC